MTAISLRCDSCHRPWWQSGKWPMKCPYCASELVKVVGLWR